MEFLSLIDDFDNKVSAGGIWIEENRDADKELPASMTKIPHGALIHNSYRVIRLIGEGGMNKVYLVESLADAQTEEVRAKNRT